jgi:hypothetical protein
MLTETQLKERIQEMVVDSEPSYYITWEQIVVDSHLEALKKIDELNKWIKVKQDIINKQNLLLYDYENMENSSIQKTTRIIPFFLHPFKGGCEECGETILGKDYKFCPWCGREIIENEIVTLQPNDFENILKNKHCVLLLIENCMLQNVK